VTDLNNNGTFAVTTDNNYSTLPYIRAKSFRVTNFSGKVVGMRLRHNVLPVDDFNDTDFTEWTGDISYESGELEGTGAARIKGSAYRALTDQVMHDGSEVEFTFVTPESLSYSLVFSVFDDASRIGLSPSAGATIDQSNSKSNTKYKVTLSMSPTLGEYVAYLEEEGKDRIEVSSGDSSYGNNNMVGSIIHMSTDVSFIVDPIIYKQKVNYSAEHIGHGGSFTYPCQNLSEYEVINLGSDAMNYSDNTQTISLSGFYVR
jgi:hypothetical protein